MIKEAIDKILSLAAPTSMTLDENLIFVNQSAKQVFMPVVETLSIGSLQGLVDILKAENPNGIIPLVNPMIQTFIHIQDHQTVSIVSRGCNEDLIRTTYATARYSAKGFEFNRFMPVEDFNIAMQALFIQDDVVHDILKITGNVVYQAEAKTLDDGRTQTISARKGIARVESVQLPTHVALTPYRTFLDLDEQPEGLFVLRIKQHGDATMAALFEADSGLWKLEAVRMIRVWLTQRLSSFGTKNDPFVIIG